MRVYLDNQATTPVDPRVLDAMIPYFEQHFGNAASSQHWSGRRASDAAEKARSEVAGLIGSSPQEVVFTSGATESDNLAIKGIARARKSDRRHVVSCATEHKAVLDTLTRLRSEGFSATLVPVDRDGFIDLDVLRSSVGSDTALVSVMAANNEIGTLTHLREVSRIAHESGAIFHCDAAQAVGKIPIAVDECEIDLMSISAHKMYGPKGIGALYVRRRLQVDLEPLIDGGGHERGLRSGTLNVPACAGFGEACRIAMAEMDADGRRTNRLAQSLLQQLSDMVPDMLLNGHPEDRLPGNLNVTFVGADADNVMLAMPDLAVSSGSACTSANPAPSHVLRAIGLTYDESQQSIRMGIGRFNTSEEIDSAAKQIAAAVKRIRETEGSAVRSTDVRAASSGV